MNNAAIKGCHARLCQCQGVASARFERNMVMQNLMSFQTFFALFAFATVLSTAKPGYRDKRRAHYNKGTPGCMYCYQDKVYVEDDIVKFGARELPGAMIPWTDRLHSVLSDLHPATYPPNRPAPTSAHKLAPAQGYRSKRRAHSNKGTPAAEYSYQDEVYAEDDIVKFGARESRDAVIPWTNGQYRVLLPDGRTQTVTYTVAEDYSGYTADVKYSNFELPTDH